MRIAMAAGFPIDRPRHTLSDAVAGLCYVAGLTDLPHEFRHRAAAALAERSTEGYAEARSLLPKNGWGWLAEAVRAGWAVWPAQLFVEDESAPLSTRLKVGQALADHDFPGSFLPPALETLARHPRLDGADRVALAVAIASRAPIKSLELLCLLASDPLVQLTQRMRIIDLLEKIDPGRALEMRAEQTRIPSARMARDQHRAKTEQAARTAEEAHQRAQPEAVVERLDLEIDRIVEDLTNRSSPDWLGCGLDDHIAECDGHGIEEDIAEICGVVRDESTDAALYLLGVLTSVRHGDSEMPPLGGRHLPEPDRDRVPRLTSEAVDECARLAAEQSWKDWAESLGEFGWDQEDDHQAELDEQREEANTQATKAAQAKSGDHLRELQRLLTWDLWPELVSALTNRDCETAYRHLATARLLGDEAEQAMAVWHHSMALAPRFDPLTLSWPHEIWRALDSCR
jgi:hypothetical protein